MEAKKEYKIPDFAICKQYLEEAKATENLPEQETDIISFNLEGEAIEKLHQIAVEWETTEENVVRAMLIALVKENK